MYWDRSKSFYAPESLLWALILDLHSKLPKAICLEESLDNVTAVTWQLDTELILVDTTPHNWVDTGAQQVVGAGIGTEIICNCYICQRQSHIISLKNARHVHPPPGPQGPPAHGSHGPDARVRPHAPQASASQPTPPPCVRQARQPPRCRPPVRNGCSGPRAGVSRHEPRAALITEGSAKLRR